MSTKSRPGQYSLRVYKSSFQKSNGTARRLLKWLEMASSDWSGGRISDRRVLAGGEPPLLASTDEYVKSHFGEGTGAARFRLITRLENDAPNLGDGNVRRWDQYARNFKARGTAAGSLRLEPRVDRVQRLISVYGCAERGAPHYILCKVPVGDICVLAIPSSLQFLNEAADGIASSAGAIIVELERRTWIIHVTSFR
jgi:hypothetical protein